MYNTIWLRSSASALRAALIRYSSLHCLQKSHISFYYTGWTLLKLIPPKEDMCCCVIVKKSARLVDVVFSANFFPRDGLRAVAMALSSSVPGQAHGLHSFEVFAVQSPCDNLRPLIGPVLAYWKLGSCSRLRLSGSLSRLSPSRLHP